MFVETSSEGVSKIMDIFFKYVLFNIWKSFRTFLPVTFFEYHVTAKVTIPGISNYSFPVFIKFSIALQTVSILRL